MTIPDGKDPVELANWLFDLCRQGDADRVAAYVDAGAPVNMADAKGNSMLMLAAYNDQPRTVEKLIERGADVNQLNERGQSILAGAMFKQATEVIQLLVDAGADLDHGHPTARETAVMFGTQIPEQRSRPARNQPRPRG